MGGPEERGLRAARLPGRCGRRSGWARRGGQRGRRPLGFAQPMGGGWAAVGGGQLQEFRWESRPNLHAYATPTTLCVVVSTSSEVVQRLLLSSSCEPRFGQIALLLGQCLPKSDPFKQIANVPVTMWPTFAKLLQLSTGIGQRRPALGQCWPTFGQLRPMPAELSQVWAEFGPHVAYLAQHGRKCRNLC